jgi:S-adenosylhomocysteine hydrolase
MGFTTVDPVGGGYSARQWLAQHAVNAPAVVVDDGGDLILDLLTDAALDARIGAIETTTKGVRLLRSAGLLDRVVNLSDTSIKDAMNHRIAVSCVYRMRELLRHEMLHGESCVVVGYGRLGRSIAPLLAGLGMVVRVVDTEAGACASAVADGFPASPDLQAVMDAARSRFVFGCSGVRTVTMSHVRTMGRHPMLCSASSQDLQPALRHLRKHAVARPVRALGTRYETGEQSITAIADGHAVNLFSAEGVSEPEYDPFTALICVGVVETAMALQRAAPPAPAEDLCRRVLEVRRTRRAAEG